MTQDRYRDDLPSRYPQIEYQAIVISGRQRAARFAEFLLHSRINVLFVFDDHGYTVFVLAAIRGDVADWLQEELVTGWKTVSIRETVIEEGTLSDSVRLVTPFYVNGPWVDLFDLASEAKGATRSESRKAPAKGAPARKPAAKRTAKSVSKSGGSTAKHRTAKAPASRKTVSKNSYRTRYRDDDILLQRRHLQKLGDMRQSRYEG